MTVSFRLLSLTAGFLGVALPIVLLGKVTAPPEEKAPAAVVLPSLAYAPAVSVPAMSVRQGGAQDVRHFRMIAAEIGLPRPDSLTAEGLFGEHDLTIPATRPCGQLFCLVAEAMPADFPSRSGDLLFAGLGFASNVPAETWRREPLNLVAVVDKSGSMEGEPLELVRKSLRQIVGQMRTGDRLSIVLYGDRSHVYLPSADVGSRREAILTAIDRIESSGSTNMEEGLRVGYDTAFATRGDFAGDTRLMLFTDEQPNVGATDADSFIGMAEAASRRGVGLTTIGVGVQFDAALATKVSSVRGGNLFFVSNAEEVRSVFVEQLDTMVSELAHDVRITVVPRTGYRLTGGFGVPGGLMNEAQDGAVTITVPTAFFSTKGGGIFVTLGRSADRAHLPAARLTPGLSLADVDLRYVSARTGRSGGDRISVANPQVRPSAPLRLAHLLVDEYSVLHDASVAFHISGKPRQAHLLLAALADRIDASRLPGLAPERKLVGEMLAHAAFASGYGGEQPSRRKRAQQTAAR
ncbi:vWA domain-containing protein [Allosphingosinicella deserti]|uniref:VWFA domain-containing protein n=1 Tax=Allosphingosinicella deserti TaxID=2116704 RepID=A0A2P7QK90_9SPHN|nr:VWA domain-containing protein [Sphingomonas deserti]PSJ38384.1 hypothetical protein C7I55_18230 [Sphingomonas deserti]